MTCISRLRYSRLYECNVDLHDSWVTDARNCNFAKRIIFWERKNGYKHNRSRNVYLHRIIADACVVNPRLDIFWMVDHINRDPSDNRPENLRWVNCQLNNLNKNLDAGVEKCHYTLKNGKIVTLWAYSKVARLRFFKRKADAIAFARVFNIRYFDALYKAYLRAPLVSNRGEWNAYWRALFIPYSQFTKENRKDVLNLRRYAVSDNFHLKMTGVST